MTFSPRCFAQPGDLRLKSVCLDGRQVEGFAKALARRPGVVIRQHPPSQFLEINDHRSTSFYGPDAEVRSIDEHQFIRHQQNLAVAFQGVSGGGSLRSVEADLAWTKRSPR